MLHITYYILHIHVHMHIHLHNWLEIFPGFYHTSKILQGCVVCQPARGVGSGSRPATACLTCSVDDANQAALPDRFLGDPQTVCNHCRALMVVVAKPSAFYSHLLLAWEMRNRGCDFFLHQHVQCLQVKGCERWWLCHLIQQHHGLLHGHVTVLSWQSGRNSKLRRPISSKHVGVTGDVTRPDSTLWQFEEKYIGIRKI